MTKIVETKDVIIFVIPEGTDTADLVALAPLLAAMVVKAVWAQWPPGQGPADIEIPKVDWLITNEVAEITEFQPAHDCAACRAGCDQAEAFLREHPDRYMALGNIIYIEYWGGTR